MQNFHIAVPTAFHSDLSLDMDTTLAHIRYLYRQGVRAVMLCGSTGEQHSLSVDERLIMLKALQQANLPDDLTVIFGVAHSFYQESVKLAKVVEENTAIDAILLAALPYIRPTQAEFIRYVEAVLAVTQKPIILYNNPRRTGFDMATDSLLMLSQYPQIIGVKDPSDVVELKMRLQRDWLIFAGGEEDLNEKIQAGFNACSSIAGNVMPQEIQAWLNALLQDWTVKLPFASEQILKEIYQNVPLIMIKQMVAENESLPTMIYHRRPR